MNNGLSKKDKKTLSKLLANKLKAMGVEDEIKYTPSGKKIKRPVFENDQVKVEDGQVVFEEIDIPVAMNPLRRTVRRLRNAPLDQIEAFLNMEVSTEPVTENVMEPTENPVVS
jgi:hypothetical protein